MNYRDFKAAVQARCLEMDDRIGILPNRQLKSIISDLNISDNAVNQREQDAVQQAADRWSRVYAVNDPAYLREFTNYNVREFLFGDSLGRSGAMYKNDVLMMPDTPIHDLMRDRYDLRKYDRTEHIKIRQMGIKRVRLFYAKGLPVPISVLRDLDL